MVITRALDCRIFVIVCGLSFAEKRVCTITEDYTGRSKYSFPLYAPKLGRTAEKALRLTIALLCAIIAALKELPYPGTLVTQYPCYLNTLVTLIPLLP